MDLALAPRSVFSLPLRLTCYLRLYDRAYAARRVRTRSARQLLVEDRRSMSKLERRQSKRLADRESAAPYAKKDAGASTGLTSYMGAQSLDWDGDGDIGEAKRRFVTGPRPRAIPSAESFAPPASAAAASPLPSEP